MIRKEYFVTDYYDKKIISRIVEKYGLDEIEAVSRFMSSQTHAMLEDDDYGLTMYPERAVFDMWESEQITGDPRNSIYIRSE